MNWALVSHLIWEYNIPHKKNVLCCNLQYEHKYMYNSNNNNQWDIGKRMKKKTKQKSIEHIGDLSWNFATGSKNENNSNNMLF